MRTNRTENTLFAINTRTPPTMTVDVGEEFTAEVRGRLRRYRGYQRGTDIIHASLRRPSAGADSRADCRARRQAWRSRRDRLLSPEQVRRHSTEARG
jgi:hypothetical protein